MWKLWAKLCRKAGLYIVFYRPDGPMRYSKQAQLLVDQMPRLNKRDLEKWFCEGLQIGSTNIQEYLIAWKRGERNGIKRK